MMFIGRLVLISFRFMPFDGTLLFLKVERYVPFHLLLMRNVSVTACLINTFPAEHLQLNYFPCKKLFG